MAMGVVPWAMAAASASTGTQLPLSLRALKYSRPAWAAASWAAPVERQAAQTDMMALLAVRGSPARATELANSSLFRSAQEAGLSPVMMSLLMPKASTP